MRIIYSSACIFLGDLLYYSRSTYFVLLYWSKAEALRMMAFLCAFAMLLLLGKDCRAGKHFCGIFLWEICGIFERGIIKIWNVLESFMTLVLLNWFCSSSLWCLKAKIMALSMEQVKRNCDGMGEKHLFNQYFFSHPLSYFSSCT